MTLPRGQDLQKPPLKAPCNNCGKCCEVAICATATYLFTDLKRGDAPCPLWSADKQCTILTRAAIKDFSRRSQNFIIKHHKQVVSVGKGCNYVSDFERWDFKWMVAIAKSERIAIDAIAATFEAGRITRKTFL